MRREQIARQIKRYLHEAFGIVDDVVASVALMVFIFIGIPIMFRILS